MKREEYFNRIRAATARLEPVAHPGSFAEPHLAVVDRADLCAPAPGRSGIVLPALGRSGLAELFASRLAELAGQQRLVRVDSAAALAALLRAELAGLDPGSILWAGEPCRQPRELAAGLTIAVAGCAASASLVVDAGSAEAGYASLLCEHSLVLLPEDRLFPEVLAWYGTPTARRALLESGTPGSSGYLVQITGASRTADIEKTLVSPAHGPARLTVILAPPGVGLPSRGELWEVCSPRES